MTRILIVLIILISCNQRNVDSNDLGYVEKLPPGEYIIWNYGSRHLVKCMRKDGKFYYLNDQSFKVNGIPGYDANQYYDKTHITIK